MKDKTKPCELTCPKCGSNDICRTFYDKGNIIQTSPCDIKDMDKWKYSKRGSYVTEATKAHIHHNCRCCQYKWQTEILKKQSQ